MSNFQNRRANADASELRLCKLTLRIATAMLHEQTRSAALESCTVLETRPGAGRNQVVIVVGIPSIGSDLVPAMMALLALRGRVRTELARSIQRKRAPAVEFEVVPLSHESMNMN